MKTRATWPSCFLIAFSCIMAISCAPTRSISTSPLPEAEAGQTVPFPTQDEISRVRTYIERTWKTLTRSHADLLAALPDPKLHHNANEPWILYVASDVDPNAIRAQLTDELGPETMRQINVQSLPPNPREHVNDITPGLLYLPRPYVVPGGRFNEMYGWDSYFIQVGLLQDGELGLAKDVIDNFIYQIEHYGTILNASRTYFLGRSQPPFLTPMILGVFEQTKDKEWLASTLPAIEKHYAFWVTAPHLAGDTGLSRYWDFGEGPAPEVLSDEKDAEGRTHYDRVKEYFRTHVVTDYDESVYYDSTRDELTPLFFKSDRSMRESGFDPSNRFGPFNIDIIHYAPADLNALLYKMEDDAARIYDILGRSAEAAVWRQRAAHRKELIDRYLWDEEAGMYFDYNFQKGYRRQYVYATTLWPLWVGVSSAEQAARVEANLYRLEAPGGLLTSTTITGNQWDAPFGWAPLQLPAIEGLLRYGYDDDARRLAAKWLSLVTNDFEEHGVIVEKYDVVQLKSDVAAGIKYGYSANQVGFGWTNGVYLKLLDLFE